MEISLVATLIAVLLVGVVIGALAIWLPMRGRSEQAAADAQALQNLLSGVELKAARLEERADRLPPLEAEAAAERARADALAVEIAGLRAERDAAAAAHAEKVAELSQLRADIDERLKGMVDAALRGNQASFMEQASQVFAHHRQGADEALAPIKESLALYQTRLAEIENARKEAYGALANELKTVAEGQGMVRAEAAKLVNALRAAPKARGRWGELQLQNLLDASGLTVGVDYVMEQSFNRDDARLRPDVIINLPGGRHIVVDAKAPLTSYMNAIESVDEAERDLQLKAHAAAVRGHVKQLSSKEYQRALIDTVDFVALFMPGDNLLAAAVERDPDLLTDAMRDRVFIVTPVTMMALAKVVAFGWRQEKVAENAKQVHDLGAELFRRLQKMGELVGSVGKNLNQTVGRYNEFVASLESRVLPQARKFTELGVAGGEEIPALMTADVAVKEPRRDRDLLFDGNAPTRELT